MVEHLLEKSDEIPVLEVNEPEHQRLAQEYVAQQDSGVLVTDYQTSFASRSASEYLTETVPETDRVTGGKTVYPDTGAWSILKSDGCWKDFQDELFPYVDAATEREVIHPQETANQKDIFVEGETDQKAVAMASRLTPRIYGAFVREQTPLDETYTIMRQDGVDVGEYSDRMFAFEEETDSKLWDKVVGDRAYSVSPEELRDSLEDQDLSLEGYSNMTDPESCIATVGRKDGKPAV